MATIGRNALLALCVFLAGCAGLEPRSGTAGYPDDGYGRGGWDAAHDPYWDARDAYYGPYGRSAFGPYGYWGYPGWWGPPVYYVYPEREAAPAEPARSGRLRPLQERMLRVAPLSPPRWTPPGPVPLPSRNRGAVPRDPREPPAAPAAPGRWSKPAPPMLKPPPMRPPPVIGPPQVRVPYPEAKPEAPRQRRPWRRPGADGE